MAMTIGTDITLPGQQRTRMKGRRRTHELVKVQQI